MKKPGPPLPVLLQRLGDTPRDFLKAPVMGAPGEADSVDTAAVVSDLLRDAGGGATETEWLDSFRLKSTKNNRNYLGVILVLCHLLHDRWFLDKKNADGMKDLLASGRVRELAQNVYFDQFVNDPERREELARLALDALGYYPKGENETTAADRLSTLDSIERKRIIQKTVEAQERAKKLREEMERQEAEEAASKMTRE